MDKLRERGPNIWIDQEGIHGAKLWSHPGALGLIALGKVVPLVA